MQKASLLWARKVAQSRFLIYFTTINISLEIPTDLHLRIQVTEWLKFFLNCAETHTYLRNESEVLSWMTLNESAPIYFNIITLPLSKSWLEQRLAKLPAVKEAGPVRTQYFLCNYWQLVLCSNSVLRSSTFFTHIRRCLPQEMVVENLQDKLIYWHRM